MTDILEKLIDLHKQATTERSHFYVAACCKEAMEEISRLRLKLKEPKPQYNWPGSDAGTFPK